MPTKGSERPKIYLDTVQLSGFKSIHNLNIDIQRGLNILIGKNGSGKSNFIEFLYNLLNFRNIKINYNFAKLNFTSSDNHSFTLELQRTFHNINFDEDSLSDRIGFYERFSIDNEVIFDNSKEDDYSKPVVFKNKRISYKGRTTLRSLFSRLGYPSLYPLYIRFNLPDTSNLGCLSLPGTLKINFEDGFSNWETPPTLRFLDELFFLIEVSYGEELKKIKAIDKANFYRKLKIDNKIKENLKHYSNIDDIRFSNNLIVYNDDKMIIIENIKIDFKVNGNWIPWSQLSDGTKRLFYIITEITNSNGLILIEEPELGIHPHQFNLVMNFLREQADDKQIVISTHSPKALDHLSIEELNCILITSYNKSKGTQIRHISNKELKKAKQYIKEVGFFSDYWMLSDLEG